MWHRCFYRRSVLIFDSKKYNSELDKKCLVKSFYTFLYISKTSHKKYLKDSMPYQSVSNKLEVYKLPKEFESIRKLEKFLIAKCILFKNVAIMPCEQMEKITGTICNIPVDIIDVNNLLPRTVDGNGLVIAKLKRKVEYRGRVFFEAVIPDFLRRALSYLKKTIIFIKTLQSEMIWKKLFPRLRVRLMV